MAHASPVPCSNGTDDVVKLSPTRITSQAATRAAYIDSVLADWPPLTPQQQNTIGLLLGNGTGGISVATYQHWEIRRQLDSENPGRHGHFTAEDAA